jgi:hypothetical protein
MVTDLVKGHERVDVVDLGPGDGNHLSSSVELHGARAEGNHGGVETHVLGLEVEHVPDSTTVCQLVGLLRVR